MLKDLEERYSRQLRFHGIGVQGQQQLVQKTVVIVGMGALGSVLANHMVRSGVGRVRLIDRDYVELSNLQRQILYDEQDVREALPKAVAAERKLKCINSAVRVESFFADITWENAEAMLDEADLVLDGTDNFATRYVLSDACFKLNIPFIYGGVVAAEGMVASFIPGQTGCFRCLTEQFEGRSGHGAINNDTCDTAGVIGPAVAAIASIQAAEALKILSERWMDPQWITLQLWPFHSRTFPIPSPRKECPVCNHKKYPALLPLAPEEDVVYLCGRESFQFPALPSDSMTLEAWKQRFNGIGSIQINRFLLKVHLPEGERMVIFSDGRILIQGTEDLKRAKSIYTRYIGG